MPAYKKTGNIVMIDGSSVAIPSTSEVEEFYVTGSPTLTTNWAVTMSKTPKAGMRIKFEYKATPTTGSNTITFLNSPMPTTYTSKKVNIDCYFDGSVWVVDYQPSFDETDIITSSMVKDLAVAKITGTASRIMEFTSGGVGQASSVTTAEAAVLAGVSPGTVVAGKAVVATTGKVIDELDITKLKKGGVEITATGAEINNLSGVTTTPSEFNTLAGVSAGTITNSKAVVVGSSGKVDIWDPTTLKINGTQITTTAAEINQIHSAGVVAADFAVIAGAAGASVVADDIKVLAGVAAAGVTAASLANIASDTDAPSKVQRKTATHTNDYTIDASTGVLCLTLSASSTVTLPDGSTNSKQVIDIIIVDNPGSAYDVDLADSGSTFYYAGSTSSDTITMSALAPGAMLKIVNSAANVWTIGKASP